MNRFSQNGSLIDEVPVWNFLVRAKDKIYRFSFHDLRASKQENGRYLSAGDSGR